MQVLMIAVKVVLSILAFGHFAFTIPVWRDARRSEKWRSVIDMYFMTGFLMTGFAFVGIWK